MLATYLLPIPIFLGKTYEITYVRLRFNSPRPASFAIYKKKRLNPAEPDPNPDQDWIPWQYYSGNSNVCRFRYTFCRMHKWQNAAHCSDLEIVTCEHVQVYNHQYHYSVQIATK